MRSPRSMGVRVPANYIPRRHSSARLALSTAARKKRQLKILGGASLPLDEVVHRLADHPCGGHIITPRQRAERCVIGVFEADGDSRLLSLTLGSGHADVYCTTLLHCLEAALRLLANRQFGNSVRSKAGCCWSKAGTERFAPAFPFPPWRGTGDYVWADARPPEKLGPLRDVNSSLLAQAA